ncbi:TadE/TadG family type IV pilus assembly protein [Coralliovum pocilloporae]|uniref:TadE/TadG family type IV pilus assembly protein n=1 Tax=Coralliovum pocilloporae TaxID=3066369 RepID=UPI003306AEF7
MHQRLRRFRSDESGTAAIEFAFVAIPFFLFVFLIFETAMAFWAGQVLESGTELNGRLIRTGQVASGNITETKFREMICGCAGVLLPKCTARLQLDVRTYANFNDITDQNIRNPDGTLNNNNLTFSTGNPNDIVVVRAFYTWNFFTGFASATSTELSSATVFVNEPFQGATGNRTTSACG